MILNDRKAICIVFYIITAFLISCNTHYQPDKNVGVENRINSRTVSQNCDTGSVLLSKKTKKNRSEISTLWQEPIAWIKQIENINSNKLITCISESKSDSVFIYIPNAHSIIDSADLTTYIRAFLINTTRDTIVASLFANTLLNIKTEIWKSGKWLTLQGMEPVIDCGNSLHECTLRPKQFLEFHLETDKIDNGTINEMMRIVLNLYVKNTSVKKHAISNKIEIMLHKEQINIAN